MELIGELRIYVYGNLYWADRARVGDIKVGGGKEIPQDVNNSPLGSFEC